MSVVKSSAEIAEKWKRVVNTRTTDFEQGVKDTSVDWATKAAASASSYEAGVQEAIGRGAFGKGVKAAGNEKWRSKLIAVGVGRWAPGVNAAVADYETGFAPFRDEIERLKANEPPRKPRGSPENNARQQHYSAGLHKKRVGA